MRRLEARHSVKQEITNAIRWGRLYGGSLAVMVIQGEEDRLEEPLDYDTLLPDCFQGLPVMAISCWGYVPEDLEIVFEPVMTSSPTERAELVQKMSSDVIEGYKAGLLTREQAIAELKSRGEELGVYAKI